MKNSVAFMMRNVFSVLRNIHFVRVRILFVYAIWCSAVRFLIQCGVSACKCESNNAVFLSYVDATAGWQFVWLLASVCVSILVFSTTVSNLNKILAQSFLIFFCGNTNVLKYLFSNIYLILKSFFCSVYLSNGTKIFQIDWVIP